MSRADPVGLKMCEDRCFRCLKIATMEGRSSRLKISQEWVEGDFWRGIGCATGDGTSSRCQLCMFRACPTDGRGAYAASDMVVCFSRRSWYVGMPSRFGDVEAGRQRELPEAVRCRSAQTGVTNMLDNKFASLMWCPNKNKGNRRARTRDQRPEGFLKVVHGKHLGF